MAESVFTQISAKYEPRLRNALIQVWEQVKSTANAAAVEEALVTGGVEAVMALLNNLNVQVNAGVSNVIDDAIREGGQAGIAAIPKAVLLQPNATFDLFNSNTANFLRQYKLNLITQVSNETREAVRSGLVADTLAGVNPRTTARNFRNNIGLTQRQELAVRNYRNHLETLDRQALQRELRDKRFDRTVRQAIEADTPLSQTQINQLTNRYREKYIRYRSEVIARTESLRAVSIGNSQAIQQLVDEGLIDEERIRKFWVYTGDARTRAAHRQIPGLNPDGRRLDEDFTTPLGPLKFPRDPRGIAANTVQCRCTVRYKVIEP